MMLAFHDSAAAGGLLSGLLHPVSGLDHVVAMVAVGLWGAQLGKPAIWLLPVAFPVVMALGGFLGLAGVGLPGIEVGIALSAVALGACVAAAWRAPLWLALLLVGVFAIFHGHAHGTELPEDASAVGYSAGFVVATGCLHGVGIALGELKRLRTGMALVRVLGVAVVGAGCWFLYAALS